MKPFVLIHRYAEAFVEGALAKGETKEPLSQLQGVWRLVNETPQLRTFFENPGIPLEQKERLLTQLVPSSFARRILLTLIEKNQLSFLPDLLTRAQELLDQKEGLLRAHVRSASALSKEENQTLAQSLEEFFGKPILIEEQVDHKLLAGRVIRVGDTVIDNSLASQLKKLEWSLSHAS